MIELTREEAYSVLKELLIKLNLDDETLHLDSMAYVMACKLETYSDRLKKQAERG